jgi:putative ABC transport system permease protein
MQLGHLIYRSLRAYWRTHLAVALAAAVGSAVLVGALAVGDSMRASLLRSLENRLGKTEHVLVSSHGFFTQALVQGIGQDLDVTAVPALYSRGVIKADDGREGVIQVHVYGVDERFYGLARDAVSLPAGAGVVLNHPLAERLTSEVKDTVLLRLEKPEYLSRDIALVPDDARSVAARLPVLHIAQAGQLGPFSLEANQAVPYNAFVPLTWLQQQLERPDLVNLLLIGSGSTQVTTDELQDALQQNWTLADLGLQLEMRSAQQQIEINSRRIFMEGAISDHLLEAPLAGEGILTYFVNQLSKGSEATPYSMVTALDPQSRLGVCPDTMTNEQIVITRWLADDLDANVGDSLDVTYFVLGDRRGLVEETRPFQICRILPMDHVAVDPNLMPAFPGLAGADNCRDWEPGIPIDLDTIRDQDESYWDQYRGSPKAFISLEAGQALWSNRYGNLTALRFPADQGMTESVTQQALQYTDPATLGLSFQSIRARSLDALNQGTDFGPLFLGLSMFLIAGAVILTGLLFVFSVESRSDQTGLLLALGFRAKHIRALFLGEGLALALLGAFAGVFVGLLYAKGLIVALNSSWDGAIAHTLVVFSASAQACVSGAIGGVIAALGAMLVTLRAQLRFEARELLSGDLAGTVKKRGRTNLSLVLGVFSLLGVIALLMFAPRDNSQAVSGVFFGAGTLLLITGICFTGLLLRYLSSHWNRPLISTQGLALRNATRRRARSLAVIGLLAFGVFMTVAVLAFWKDPSIDVQSRSSGTGGFSWIGQSSLGILYDINTESGQDSLGLDAQILADTQTVPLRVRDGDEASCLNLNRAQTPRLLGVDPNQLAQRGSFTFAKTIGISAEQPWHLLNLDLGPDEIPAIGDQATVTWGLGLGLAHTDTGSRLFQRGDPVQTPKSSVTLSDEKGRTFKLRIVGMVSGSVLQGSLIVAEDKFIERFPGEEGYRMLLIDCPEEEQGAVADHLSDRLQDLGLSFTGTQARLAALNEIQNTYLSMFLALGGLGLLVGSIGLGLVVLRNLLDRRAELGMLLAVGLSPKQLRHMVFYEHWGLLLAGLFWGCLAALLAIVPATQLPSLQVPYKFLGLLLAFIALSGALWIWMATRWALSGKLMDALRNE